MLLCFALWEGAADIPAKASALGLETLADAPGASISVGKSTIRFYRAPQGNLMVSTISTIFADGKDSSCDINLNFAVPRAELEALEKAADLDGQIVTLGPTTMGRWKMRKRQPAVLIKAMATKTSTIVMVQKLEATPAVARAKQGH